MSDAKPPPPPPGWYPDHSGVMRWWDGTEWTDHLHAPPANDEGELEIDEPDGSSAAGPSPRRRVVGLLAATILLAIGAVAVYASGVLRPEPRSTAGPSIALTLERISKAGVDASPKVSTEKEIVDQYLRSICPWNYLSDQGNALVDRGQTSYAIFKPHSKRLMKASRHGAEVIDEQPLHLWPAEYEDDRLGIRDVYISDFTRLRGIRAATSEDEFWTKWNAWAEADDEQHEPFQRFKLDIGLPNNTDTMCKKRDYWEWPPTE